ncbi:MAG TPA: tyrosine recombinase [Acidimicrobiales bacterium]|nr:tyrosine recombinase [Acidimicrobiales bacterium]
MSALGAPVSPASEEYLSWLAVERGRATNTLASYRRDLVHYEAALSAQGRSPLDARQEDVERYVARLRAAGQSAASVARAVSSIRGLHRFLVDEGDAAHDPTVDLETGRLPARLPKALPEAEVGRVLDGVSGDDPIARRDRALLELLYGTGARVSEAVGLHLGDLAGGDGLVRLYGKGSKERLVPLGTHAARALARWLDVGGRDALAPERWRRKGDAEAVFLNTRGSRLTRQGAFAVVRARGAAAGVDLAPHALRHSCATHMLAHGADVRVVQELLGHASVTTTQLYTKVTNDHLRAAYDAAHPRAGEAAGTRR